MEEQRNSDPAASISLAANAFFPTPDHVGPELVIVLVPPDVGARMWATGASTKVPRAGWSLYQGWWQTTRQNVTF